ncbi:MAG: serpin family protein [Candidatus Aenigmarchaeota archaeon]|nr:serpin family protein [Candidatus Aenigmarchaeota archaeon]
MHLKILTNLALIAAIFLVVIASGCTNTEAPVVVDSSATPEDVNSVVNANNQFAFDLYSEFKDEEDNVFFSPYSISTALAMTYEGAKGETAKEMQTVLHIPEDSTIRMPAFARIYNEINKGDKKYKLSTANALWAQKDYGFLNEYTNNVEQYYGGKVTNLDFVGDTENSRQTINKWVEDQTNDKIKDLIPQGVLNALTRLVLTNAIYFKGTWAMQFDEKNTVDEEFTTSSGQTSKVPMMSLTGDDAKFNYAETNEAQILEMSYDGDELSMLILLPKENNLGAFEEALNSEKISEFKSMFKEQRVDVYIPKFKFETKYFMVETLKNMGMPTAFTGAADFSGMDGTKSLYIAEVIHQAFVEVNEEGTEAAAATAVLMERSSSFNKPKIPIFRADHPFIFIIQQKSTGNILFLGRVSDPSK